MPTRWQLQSVAPHRLPAPKPTAYTPAESRATGLGLSIARGIAKGLGGDVAVQGEVGKGSMFTMTLPLWKDI